MKPLRLKMKMALTAALIGTGTLVFYACINPVGDGLNMDDFGYPRVAVPPETTLSAMVQPIFTAKCIQCHAPGGIGYTGTTDGTNIALNLKVGASYASLFNVATFELPAQQPTFRVRPGSSDSSYLYQKISSSTPKFGVQMPASPAPHLSDAEIKIIKRWIEKGAPQ